MEHISETLKKPSFNTLAFRFHINELMMLRDDLEYCINKAKDVKEFNTINVKSIHKHMIDHLRFLDERLSKMEKNYER